MSWKAHPSPKLGHGQTRFEIDLIPQQRLFEMLDAWIGFGLLRTRLVLEHQGAFIEPRQPDQERH